MQLFKFRDPAISVYHTFDEHFTPFGMHTHITAELYCMLRGKGIYRIEGNLYELNPGDILLMRPGEAHHMQADPNVPYERMYIDFDPQLLKALDPEGQLLRPYYDRKAGTLNHFPADPAYMPFINGVLDPGGNRATVTANLILLLQKLCDTFEQNRHIALQPQSLEYKIIRYINHNLEKDLSVQALCDHFYVSRSQLNRRFMDATNVPVGRYVTVKRMLLARQLLSQGKKATEVFAQCGYKDYSAFYRAYKSYYGSSPNQGILEEKLPQPQ